MGLIFNGNGDVIKAVDGSLTVEGLDLGGSTNIEAGIGTFSGNLNVGGVLTYEDVKNVDSVGIVTARAGVRVTGGDILLTGGDGRKISFANDGSSHYFKMDNSFNGPVINGYGGIKFETNGTNERLRILSNGNVGINETAPDTKLVVSNGGTSSSASGGTLARIVGSGVARLDIVGGNSNHSILEFSRANLTAAGQITYTHSDNSLSFTVNGAQEKLRITSTGEVNVGGNYTQTTDKLQVSGNIRGTNLKANAAIYADASANTALYLHSTGTTGQSRIFLGDASTFQAGKIVYDHTNDYMMFGTGGAGAERMRIDSSGRIGIGTVTPSKALHVYKSNEHPLLLERGDSSNTQIELRTGGAIRGYWGCSTTANFMVYDNDTSDINFTVLQTGNVGIGIANPSNKLEISGGLVRCLGSASARFTANNGSAEGFIGFNSGTFHIGEASATTQIAAAGANYITMNTNSNERLRIDSSGRVLIGNTSNTGVAGHGVRIQSDAVGSNYATGALALRGTGGDFYAITMLGDSGNAWGMLPIFSSTPDRLSFGYYASSGSSNTSIFTIYADGKALINSGYLQAQDLQIGLAGDRYPIIQRAVASSGSQSLSITGGSGYSTNTASAHTPTDAKQGALIVLKAGNPTSDTFGGGIQYYANGHTSPNNPGSGNQHVFYTRSGANTYAERIRIEEGGRILINTPGTSINAHEQCDDVVIGNVSHGHDTGVTIVSGTSYNGWIAFSDGTTNSTRRRGAIVYHHPSDTMYLRTNNNQTALQISSDGEVTKPRNPAFSVRHSANQSVTTAGWTQKTFNTEMFDIGGNFSSNAFTAPVDGIYSFGWNQRFDSGNGNYFRIVLRVNDSTGTSYQHGHSIYRDDDGFHYVTLNLTSLLQLDAGDTVKAYAFSNTDTSYTLQPESVFWGYLVS